MNQKDINDAVDYLYTHGAKYAEAKGHRVYLEEYRKSQKAMLMKAAMTEGKAKTAAAAEVEADVLAMDDEVPVAPWLLPQAATPSTRTAVERASAVMPLRATTATSSVSVSPAPRRG